MLQTALANYLLTYMRICNPTKLTLSAPYKQYYNLNHLTPFIYLIPNKNDYLIELVTHCYFLNIWCSFQQVGLAQMVLFYNLQSCLNHFDFFLWDHAKDNSMTMLILTLKNYMKYYSMQYSKILMILYNRLMCIKRLVLYQ